MHVYIYSGWGSEEKVHIFPCCTCTCALFFDVYEGIIRTGMMKFSKRCLPHSWWLDHHQEGEEHRTVCGKKGWSRWCDG
jgi:hypothetical protein